MPEFGPWLPDLPALNNPGCVEARNVRPRIGGYGAMPGLTTFSTSLSAQCQGAFAALDKLGAVHLYAGEGNALYRFANTTPTGASLAGGYNLATDQQWEFTVWGERVLASNINDPLQGIQMGNTSFSSVVTSTLKPQARHIAVVGDFVVLGNTKEGSTITPNRVRWSALGDLADFDSAAATQAGYQDLQGPGGWVQSVVGGEFGLIFRDHSITRMTYVNSPLIFQFDEVERNRGVWAPYSTISHGRFTFFIADDGFYVWDGAEAVPIGREQVDRTFFNEVDETYKGQISAAIDPDNSIVAWAYTTSATAGNGDPDKIILFNWRDKRWAWVDLDVEIIFTTLSTGYTLDGLDNISTNIDSLAPSLDSRAWTGGNTLLGAFDRGHRLSTFTGSTLVGEIITREQQLFPKERAFVSSVRPEVDGSSVDIAAAVGSRDRLIDSVSFGTASTINANGECPIEDDAVYQRFRFSLSASFAHAIGYDVTAVPNGVP